MKVGGRGNYKEIISSVFAITQNLHLISAKRGGPGWHIKFTIILERLILHSAKTKDGRGGRGVYEILHPLPNFDYYKNSKVVAGDKKFSNSLKFQIF